MDRGPPVSRPFWVPAEGFGGSTFSTGRGTPAWLADPPTMENLLGFLVKKKR